MPSDLNEMVIFARVVRAGSFTAAAAELRVPKSTVSRKVSELEQRLSARLLQRPTRKLSLTDVGRTYYDYCARIALEIEDAERAVSTLQSMPRGLLRVTCGTNMQFLAPIVGDYLKRYPDVRLELVCTGRAVDLVEERFDLGIRAGALADSSLIARSLGAVSWVVVAAPSYVKKSGRPRTPADLAKHALLVFGSTPDGATFRLENGAESVVVTGTARLTVNDFDLLHDLTVMGHGVAVVPAFRCLKEIEDRRLVRLLAPWAPRPTPVHVVYPSTRHLSPKVKTFVDHLQERTTPPPWEVSPNN
jgi:DNA-binding transcriptional LysR family regulator